MGSACSDCAGKESEKLNEINIDDTHPTIMEGVDKR